MTESYPPKHLIKIGLWLYVILLIFEGSLRKWFLPMLSGPLAIIRDPLALALIFMALRDGVLKSNFFLNTTIVITIIALGTTLILGHGNIGVGMYGARITLLHFPLIFIFGSVLERSDVLRIGRFFLYLSIPMTVLMITQFYSPQSAWVNRGIGGDLEGAGFQGAMGFFRPPGTFSFITGLTQFYGITACYIIYYWFHTKEINKLVLLLATVGLIAAIPFSISRTLLFQTIVIVFFMLIFVGHRSKYLPRVIIGSLVSVLLFFALSTTETFKTPMEAFTSRIEGASEYEGGVSGTLVDRYLGGMVRAFFPNSDAPFFGHGLGIGTNAGGQLLTGTKTWLIDSEDEWMRLVGESGLLLGLAFILIRLGLGIYLSLEAYKRLVKGDVLPWILLSFCLLILPNGQWGQPTSLGFAILITGLTIASLTTSKNNNPI